MSVAEAIILGLIQGVTEFLPISSSGHLVLAKSLFGVETPGASLEVLVHVATVFSILTMVRQTVQEQVFPGIGLLVRAVVGRISWKVAWEAASLRLVVLVLWGTVPGGLAGLFLAKPLEGLFSSPRVTLVFLLVTGVILQLSRYRPASTRPVGFVSGTLIGLAQATAVVPGISRSGITITAGLLRGLEPRIAAEFSFLLLIPVVAGAGLVSLLRPPETGMGGLPVGAAAAGFVAAYLAGCVAIGILLKHIRKGGLIRYSYYCWAVGVLGLILLGIG